MRAQFCAAFLSESSGAIDDERTGLDSLCHQVNNAMSSASGVIPSLAASAQRPWITSRTLLIIGRRNQARVSGNLLLEGKLNRKVRSAAKVDRKMWPNESLRQGTWDCVRKLRKPASHKQGRLRNLNGDLVGSELRSETLAEYLETVQWTVTFADVQPGTSTLHSSEVDINVDLFSLIEIR